ncbi:uncharacterized protein PITG_11732 [Phytophthora infestans T30-4]|uniref:Uncharacterized protein n=1 Tax=Phytophthora infestans (strain T30-4) TaxID=403677 RepID=D0NIF4_PHYIT|nr:uncharacterized protein PITG_11732 [Phytophthora infestans T30-4]EEY59239.1 hypothetical protein PITG_11732 [Phytophthora infestans T30-4]|eukprot:XP_002901253.1 hypothetical protein PITG_11732 [Phytophthora infestans T30-4]
MPPPPAAPRVSARGNLPQASSRGHLAAAGRPNDREFLGAPGAASCSLQREFHCETPCLIEKQFIPLRRTVSSQQTSYDWTYLRWHRK